MTMMDYVRRWLHGQPEAESEPVLIHKVSMCADCGRIFVNEDEAPEHMCIQHHAASHSFEADTEAVSPHYVDALAVTLRRDEE